MNKIKLNNGITFSILIITIVLMLILSIIGINVTINYKDEIKLRKFNSELEIVSDRVNVISKKIELGNKNYLDYGREITTDEQNFLKDRGYEKTEEFRLFDKDALEKIDITGINQNIFINFNTGQVVSKDGITIKGQTYYVLSK